MRHSKKPKVVMVGFHTKGLARRIVARLQREGHRIGRWGKRVYVESPQAQRVRDMPRRG